MALLQVVDLDASITDVPVLRKVSFTMNEGEIVSLAGPNGAGKTTTMRSIVGLLDDTDGTIKYRDEDISTLQAHERKQRGIGFCPQERRMFSRLTARENVMISLWGSDERFDTEAQFETVLDVFPMMESFLDRPAGNLSGGEQQMVAIARALVSDPDLLLLDEPFEGLAPSIRTDVREACQRIGTELDVAVLITESHISRISDITDRAYIIERGEIITDGTPSALVNDPAVMQVFKG